MPLRRAIHRATLTRLKLLITTMEIWIGACTTAGKPSCGQEADTILARPATRRPRPGAGRGLVVVILFPCHGAAVISVVQATLSSGVPRRSAWLRTTSCCRPGSLTWKARSVRSSRRCPCSRGWRSGRRRRRRPSPRRATATRARANGPGSRPAGRGSVAAGSGRAHVDTAAGTTPISRPVRRSMTSRRASGCVRAAARTTPRSGKKPASRSTGRSS